MKKSLFFAFLFFAISLQAGQELETLLQSCKQKNEESCKKALPLVEAACEQDFKNCSDLGFFYIQGVGGLKTNSSKAMDYFDKSCLSGNMLGCVNVGLLYESGLFRGRQNFKKAKEAYEKACNNNNAVGCTNLGVLYFHGHGVEKNVALATKLFESSCKAGNKKACENYRLLQK